MKSAQAALERGALELDRRRHQLGQSLVEVSISLIVLLVLVMGLLDLGRVFYFDVSLHGAAREGARHAIWFDPGTDSNPYLDDADVKAAVNQNLAGSNSTATFQNNGSVATCPTPSDGNSYHNPPFAASYYPTSAGATWLYICYRRQGGAYLSGLTAPPGDNSYSQGDVGVILLQSYGLVTMLGQSYFGTNGTVSVAGYAHMNVQGSPP